MVPVSLPGHDFNTSEKLIRAARGIFLSWDRLYWVLGGSGSGKSTVCRHLSGQTGIPLYDMDSQIYGDYHSRFIQNRHPANWEWSRSENGLAWLLDRSWESFLQFNRAALPEYLDLLAEDLSHRDPAEGLLIDGGIFTPCVAARVLPANRMVCIAAPWQSSSDLWEGDQERRQMKAAFGSFPDPDGAWNKFLEFDRQINRTLLQECTDCGIPIIIREKSTSIPDLANRIMDGWKAE